MKVAVSTVLLASGIFSKPTENPDNSDVAVAIENSNTADEFGLFITESLNTAEGVDEADAEENLISEEDIVVEEVVEEVIEEDNEEDNEVNTEQNEFFTSNPILFHTQLCEDHINNGPYGEFWNTDQVQEWMEDWFTNLNEVAQNDSIPVAELLSFNQLNYDFGNAHRECINEPPIERGFVELHANEPHFLLLKAEANIRDRLENDSDEEIDEFLALEELTFDDIDFSEDEWNTLINDGEQMDILLRLRDTLAGVQEVVDEEVDGDSSEGDLVVVEELGV